MSKNYKSVFDIIGPVMIGPSSSHTAGAAYIGKMAKSIFGETPTSANIYLFESFAKTYQGHGTNIALAGGLLGMDPSDPNLHDSLLIAKEKGLDIRFIPLDDKVEHPNTAKLVMRSGDKRMDVTGVSIGGGNAKITMIDGISVDIDSGVATLLIFHRDTKGMIAKVAMVLSDLNIGSMKVDRESRGKNAYMVITLDQDTVGTALEALRAIDNIERVLYIPK